MKNINVILKFVFCLISMVLGVAVAKGQVYKLGDLYTFEDGTKGVVFYVNPDDPTTGTVAALNDLDGQFALWSGVKPQALVEIFTPFGGISFRNIAGWENHGRRSTQVLAESGVSPAANAIESEGWYIPDVMQLYKLYASVAYLSPAFESYGGNISSLCTRSHWSSTIWRDPSEKAYSIASNMRLESVSGMTAKYVRLVRDFPDTASVQAYWTDSRSSGDTVVSPSVTTSYGAVAVYRSDTLSLAANVTVFWPASDTLYETVYASPQPYTSQLSDLFDGLDISLPGDYEYRDTLQTVHGCDSIVTLLLTVNNNVHYSDTLCSLKEDYYFAPLDTVFAAGTVSGVYEHHGTKTVDGVPVDTIAYYELTILPAYEQFDTTGWCLYELSETRRYEGDSRVTITVNGTSVTVTSETEEIVVEEIASVPGTTADFALRMQTVDGCDSVVFLHVDARRVERDTVRHVVSEHQVVDGRVTVSGHTFEGITAAGAYELRDTLTAGNGCDSIVTLLLTVSNNVHYSDTLCSLKEDYYFAPLDTVFAAGTVSGVYEHHGTKTVDGVPVDTIAYYELTILPAYEQFDTTGWCLYELSETRRYEGDSRVTITVNGTSVTVTSETEEIVVEEIASVPGTTADFALRMQTVDGCDSVVFLHVDARRVERDTVRHVVSEHQVVDGRVTVSGHTFEDIAAAGVYELRDTLPAGNGCDSIEVYELTVTPCVSDFSILCPPDVYDTLAYGDCVMTIYPERLGTPTVLYDGEWPFLISNDIPADYLFAQGDNVVTWTATDPECGNSVTCEQHVVIAFPQCPDAVDYEGNVYHGVRIGCNCWTQRNLESTKYSDRAEIAGRYAYANLQYPDTSANVAVFGRLYSFEAAVRDSADNGHGHIQGICPDGWFLPTPEHYESLNEYGTPALRSPNLWIVGAGDNSTGFTALPAGFYNGRLDRYEGLLTETYFWSTKDVGSSVAKHVYAINYYCDAVVEQHPSSGLGFSVRCIKEK